MSDTPKLTDEQIADLVKERNRLKGQLEAEEEEAAYQQENVKFLASVLRGHRRPW